VDPFPPLLQQLVRIQTVFFCLLVLRFGVDVFLKAGAAVWDAYGEGVKGRMRNKRGPRAETVALLVHLRCAVPEASLGSTTLFAVGGPPQILSLGTRTVQSIGRAILSVSLHLLVYCWVRHHQRIVQ